MTLFRRKVLPKGIGLKRAAGLCDFPARFAGEEPMAGGRFRLLEGLVVEAVQDLP